MTTLQEIHRIALDIKKTTQVVGRLLENQGKISHQLVKPQLTSVATVTAVLPEQVPADAITVPAR